MVNRCKRNPSKTHVTLAPGETACIKKRASNSISMIIPIALSVSAKS